jgi:hypothetical protein
MFLNRILVETYKCYFKHMSGGFDCLGIVLYVYENNTLKKCQFSINTIRSRFKPEGINQVESYDDFSYLEMLGISPNKARDENNI